MGVAELPLKVKKPVTHKGKRHLEDQQSKLVENDKSTLFMRGLRTSKIVSQSLQELDDTGIEKFSSKYDASMFLFGSHQKKRPHNLVFGRLYDHHVMDMIEVGVENFKSLTSFKIPKCMLDVKPCLVFHGDQFQTDPTFKRCKNLFIDFFQGPVVENLRLQGLELVLSFTAVPGKVLFRSYRIFLKKSGTRIPRVELEEMGPSCDFVIRRTKLASDDLFKLACKQPPELKVKKVKNISRDVFGTKLARIHLGKQNISRLQTRKLKALKPDAVVDQVTSIQTESDVSKDENSRHRRRKVSFADRLTETQGDKFAPKKRRVEAGESMEQ